MNSFYETKALVDQYLLFHYGEPEEVLPYSFGPRESLNFAANVVNRGINAAGSSTGNSTGNSTGSSIGRRALDLGCAVGRSSFELSKYYSFVLGIDKSEAFITAAEDLRTNGSLEYERLEEAPKTTRMTARLPLGADPQKVSFQCGDALALPDGLGNFDLVLAANLIDRLPDPAGLLLQMERLVQSGGIFILTSPYTWLADFTPANAWLSNRSSGYPDALSSITDLLTPAFECLAVEDLPFLIREHRRKFQWSVAQFSVWRRNIGPA